MESRQRNISRYFKVSIIAMGKMLSNSTRSFIHNCSAL